MDATEARAPIEARIRELDARMDRLLGDVQPDPRDQAARLAALEGDILELVPAAAGADPGGGRHTVLADAGRWRDLAADAGAPEAAQEADRLVARLIADRAADWDGAPAPEDADACFRALSKARVHDLEALTFRRARPPLAELRPRLREALAEAVAKHPPDERTRRAWTTELLDRANAVLTDADEIPPHRAQLRLGLVARELDWHADHIETRRGRRRTRLRFKARRLRAERQERDLLHRLEQRYGPENVARSERLVLWLIVLVLGLLGIELLFDVPEGVATAFMIVDTLACCVFLADVWTRFRLVRGKAWWAARHFLVDILPSLPFAFALRVLRGVRLFRLARLFRAFGFLTRGSDRLVRRYGHMLNRDVVLYPTREERRRARETKEGPAQQLRRVQARLNGRWERLLTTAPREARAAVVRARLATVETAREAGALRGGADAPARPSKREIPADDLLRNLATLTPEEIEAEMGQDFVVRVARWVRLFSLPPLRWMPFLRHYVPRVSRGMGSADVVAAAAHAIARRLKRNYRRWFWFADLYGTVTPAQFVDRVGTAMVKASFRPAYRLVLFGLIVLVFNVLFDLGNLTFFQRITEALFGFVGVLGTICLFILGVGWWLRRIAGQATDFFEQSAHAQHLALTEAIKGRHIDRDAAVVDRHVFAAERALRGESDPDGARIRFTRGVRRWLIEAQAGDGLTAGFDPVERAVLLYRDGLDGALLCDSDIRTTGQLLGNPALRNLRALSGRFGKREKKALFRLDLARQKSLFGPYLWFSLACQAVAHGAARLIVDYNRFALPLDQLDDASEAERAQYEAWLRAEEVADVPSDQVLYVTTTFTALHFLDDDPDRDREVEVRFGKAILERLQRDRRHLFRRIFGTYPLHRRPREERVVNLFEIYQDWFAGGRSLLMPLRAAGWLLRSLGRFFGWLRRCIREVRRPSFEVDAEAARGADYATALRKIQRMRGPLAEASIRMRARFDPEYLGVRLRGTETTGMEGADARSDLRFLAADPDFEAEIEEERARAARDLVRFGRLVEDGLWERVARILDVDVSYLGGEHRRAGAAAYVADLDRVRRLLSAEEVLLEVYEAAARAPARPRRLWPNRRLHDDFRRFWDVHGGGGRRERKAAWRATLHNVDGARDALEAWAYHGKAARDEGVAVLARLLRHPERITDQLVTLRIVQTLSLLDVLNYREHVYRMGAYARDGDEPGESLELS